MLFKVERGPEEASATKGLIFLHGFGGCAAQWRGYQRRFASRIANRAYDLPGHAGSLDALEKFSPKAAAQAILDDCEGWSDDLHLVGHSMGGAVAALMALLAPERVKSLVLLAPGGFGPEIAIDTLKTWAAARTRAELAAVLPKFFHGPVPSLEKVIDLHEKLRGKEEAAQRLVAISEGLAPDGVQGVLPLEQLWQTNARISVIWGREDLILPVSQAEALQPLADQGRISLCVEPEMGHSPAEEAPELVEQVIDTHLG